MMMMMMMMGFVWLLDGAKCVMRLVVVVTSCIMM